MTAVDWIALAVLVASLTLGLLRGFVREALALLAWVAAFVAAKFFAPQVALWIPGIDQPGLRQAAAIVIIVLLVLILAHMLAIVIGKLIKVAGLGGLNHFLGMLFGVARAGVLLVLLTLVAGMTALPCSPAWKHSLVGQPLVTAAQSVLPWLPGELAALIRFS